MCSVIQKLFQCWEGRLDTLIISSPCNLVKKASQVFSINYANKTNKVSPLKFEKSISWSRPIVRNLLFSDFISLFKKISDLRYLNSITYQSSLGFDKRPVLSIHLVIEATGITEIVTIAITSPQWSGGRTTVHTFTTLWNIKTGISSSSVLYLDHFSSSTLG